jgi:hypothetical protein
MAIDSDLTSGVGNGYLIFGAKLLVRVPNTSHTKNVTTV